MLLSEFPKTDVPEPEEHVREETPTVDRRMTLIPEQHSPRVQQESPVTQITPEIEEEVFKKPAPIAKSAPIVKQDSEEEVIVKKTPVEEVSMITSNNYTMPLMFIRFYNTIYVYAIANFKKNQSNI